MGKLIAGMLLAAAIAFTGCAPVYQQAIARIRRPGEQIATTPEQIWRDFKCAHRERPFVRAESMEVVPAKINPGSRVNCRLVYVMCPVNPSEVIKTRVFRRIFYKGHQVAANVNEAFEIKPGRWIVDSFFTLPLNSPPGVYALEVSFQSPDGQAHSKMRTFVVGNADS